MQVAVACAYSLPPASFKVPSETASEREHGSEDALGTALLAEEQSHRCGYAAEEGAADEERGDLSGEERFAPPAHPYQGGGYESCLYDDDRLLGAVEGS